MSYTIKHDWNSIEIKAGPKGWIIDTWSAVTGTLSGERKHVAYDEQLPRGTDLATPWNDYVSCGEYLSRRPGRLLRKGHVVR